MKAVLSHAYSRHNAGDWALLSVLVDDIRSVDPDADITILTLDPTEPGETLAGYPLLPAFMFHALNRFPKRPQKLLYSGYIVAVTTLAAGVRARLRRRFPLPRSFRRLMDLYEEADIVVPVGGGYISGRKGLASTVELGLILHPLVLSKMLGKPVVLYTQSIGPFGNRLQRWMTAPVLRRMDLVIAREDITVHLLAGLGVSSNVIRSVDAGFAFDPSPTPGLRAQLGVAADDLLVGITVRNWLPSDGQASYEQAVAVLADHVIDRHGATVVFVPQVTSEHHGDDDRVVSRRVAARMQRKAVVLNERFDHETVKGMYADLDLLVGTRFHSVIFALTALVPSLAIAYEHKTTGIMRDLDLSEWVLEIETVTGPELIDLFDRLVVQREAYRRQLRDRLPAYQDIARQTKQRLHEVLEGVRTAGAPARP
jgi:colanic acid/amylovoran biosynthesis protein